VFNDNDYNINNDGNSNISNNSNNCKNCKKTRNLIFPTGIGKKRWEDLASLGQHSSCQLNYKSCHEKNVLTTPINTFLK